MEKTATLNIRVSPIVKGHAEEVMSSDEFHAKLESGYGDIEAGKVQNAANAFAKFRENH